MHFCVFQITLVRGREPFVHSRNKRRPVVNLSVGSKLASSIVVTVLRLSFHEGTHNPDELRVALSGAMMMVEIVVDGFVPSTVRWISIHRSVLRVRFRNLKFVFLFIAFNVGEILHHEFPFSFLP